MEGILEERHRRQPFLQDRLSHRTKRNTMRKCWLQVLRDSLLSSQGSSRLLFRRDQLRTVQVVNACKGLVRYPATVFFSTQGTKCEGSDNRAHLALTAPLFRAASQ